MSRIEQARRMTAMLHSRPHLSPRVRASVETELVPSLPLPFARPRSSLSRSTQERRHRTPWSSTQLPWPPLAPVLPSAFLCATSVQTDHPISFLTPPPQLARLFAGLNRLAKLHARCRRHLRVIAEFCARCRQRAACCQLAPHCRWAPHWRPLWHRASCQRRAPCQ
jgi:hypothetical protein